MLAPEVRPLLRALGEWPIGQPITLYWPKKGLPTLTPASGMTEAIAYPSTVEAITAVWAVSIAHYGRAWRYPVEDPVAET